MDTLWAVMETGWAVNPTDRLQLEDFDAVIVETMMNDR
jgi:hypothetical protein